LSITRAKTSSIAQGPSTSKSFLANNPVILGGSYESIATVTVGSGGSASILFSSIPSTFKHLQIRGIGRSDRSGATLSNTFLQINGNSTTPYTHYLRGDGTSESASAFQDAGGIGTGYISAVNAGTNMFNAQIIDILDYTNTNKYKTIRTLSGIDVNGSGIISLFSGADMTTTAAITSISLNISTYNWVQHSTFALYGIN
jgi:hypothetical protein